MLIKYLKSRWFPQPQAFQTIQTKRLILRPWREDDWKPFARMNADPRVMEYFPSTLSKQESDDLARRLSDKVAEQGWGLWAVSIPEVAEFIGFIGLAKPSFEAHFTPAIEVGWRLAYDYWGQGYATEGALAALEYGFETLQLNEIVSFTAQLNDRSRKVMRKIGMHHDPIDDFDHPRLSKEHQLCRHVLYRIKMSEWQAKLND
ncbi:acetyltransferase, GNAT-family [Candidatus Protochlamydia naegleriophila]|uniref:Acetyltransferase, GNAT-family n=1 Tax=Candidatus Protochlamydia naegleriophila TaxID=389348 RepID=A0A0U5JHE9_9BACT|nr:GNAT family N-acetyltransferase [Candidatus Protochlamydia naegleriophila]CUI17397.1 acetyltransferase, GNAT-family [Candidatus Protochlamydia naegleriophila]